MSSPFPFAWHLRKVGEDGQWERFALKFLEFSKPALWRGDGRELSYEQARREALGRGISTGAFDVAVQRERHRFMRAD